MVSRNSKRAVGVLIGMIAVVFIVGVLYERETGAATILAAIAVSTALGAALAALNEKRNTSNVLAIAAVLGTAAGLLLGEVSAIRFIGFLRTSHPELDVSQLIVRLAMVLVAVVISIVLMVVIFKCDERNPSEK